MARQSLDTFRVALVCHEYPPYQIGGVGSHCYDLARYLSKKGIDTTVFCGRSPQVTEERITENLTIVRLPFPDVPLRAYWFQLDNYSLLKRRLKPFEVVHLVNPQSSAACAFLRGGRGPLLTTVHGVPRSFSRAFFNGPSYSWTFREFMSNLYEMPANQALSQYCIEKSSTTVLVSRSLLAEAKNAFHLNMSKVRVIPNGIDFTRIGRIRRDTIAKSSADSSILFYGRLAWTKGITYLLDAVAELKDEFPDIMIKVIGRGPMLGRLHQKVRKFGLDKNVNFLGYLPRHDSVIAEIFRSSIIVLPSIYEAGSVALLEAMACGKAVVAFDYSFSREVIQDDSGGLLAKPKDSEDLADKIRSLLEDKKLRKRLGDGAFQRVFNHYNWEKLVDDYINLYRDSTQ